MCSDVPGCAQLPSPATPRTHTPPPRSGLAWQAIEVEDFWVFEHSLKAAAANRWRVAGRLSIQPDPAVAAAAVGSAAGMQPQQLPAQQQPASIRVGHIAEQQQEQQQRPAKEPGHQTGGERRAAKLAAKQAAAAGRGKR